MVALAKKLARYPVNGRKRHGVRSAFLFGGLFDAATTRQINAASPIG
jgi:hypothetical protein